MASSESRALFRPIRCIVHFLDNSNAAFEVDKRDVAQILLNKVFEHLEVVEREYFGLQFTDTSSSAEDNDTVFKLHSSEVVRWLDPTKSIKKQVKLLSPYEFSFRVKFYVTDPYCMREEYTRYHLFLQLTKDMVEGRLEAPYNTAILLASYAVQSELGDYSMEEHGSSSTYLNEFTFVPDQTSDMLDAVALLHRKHRGMSPAMCELLYIDAARKLPTYGLQLYKAQWDGAHDGESVVELGVSCSGLVLFKDSRNINNFTWSQIVKISFKRRQFFVYLRKDFSNANSELLNHSGDVTGSRSDSAAAGPANSSNSSSSAAMYSFNMFSYRCCKSLWRSCVEHHTFFSQLQHRYQNTSVNSRDSTNPSTGPINNSEGYGSQFSQRSQSDRPVSRPLSSSLQQSTAVHLPPISTASQQQQLNRSLDSSSSIGARVFNNSAHVPSVSTAVLNPGALRNPPVADIRRAARARAGYVCDSQTLDTRLLNHSPNTSFDSAGFSNSSAASYVADGFCTDVGSTVVDGYSGRNTDSGIGNSMLGSMYSNGDTVYNSRPNSSTLTNNTSYSNTMGHTNSSLPSSNQSASNRTSGVSGNNGDLVRHQVEYSHQYGASISRAGVVLADGSDQSRSVLRPASCNILRGGGGDIEGGTWRGGVCRPQSAVVGHIERRTSNMSEESEDESASIGCYGDMVGGGRVGGGGLNSLTCSVISQSERSPTEHSYDLPPHLIASSGSTSTLTGSTEQDSSHHHPGSSSPLITISMRPDARGTFGFNVKGGTDQQAPIVVSRVAVGSPADVCEPRLQEGHQVLFINGRDVSQHTHAQVVQFIRAARETHSGELILVVRPNVLVIDGGDLDVDVDDYSPDQNNKHSSSSSSSSVDQLLCDSIARVKQSLAAGTAVPKFEAVYRKNASMSMSAAVQSENLTRNRYRDILPYDETRVKLMSTPHDYINANHVKMEISGSGVVNRYIAAQGPLPETVPDFWTMIWEQGSSLIVMLTTILERGRVKCHKYWPDLDTTTRYRDIVVQCVGEERTKSFEFRDFIVSRDSKAAGDRRSGIEDGAQETRRVHQMQYLSWPDHGVPDDSTDFLLFVQRVRQHRQGVEPIVVHCSAGIGRTGVLITMETCMCMIEANQAIDLLSIVRTMRDQRAMLIQTSDQYKFVCGALIRVFDEKIVEPIQDLKA